jgi:hypothetical protein
MGMFQEPLTPPQQRHTRGMRAQLLTAAKTLLLLLVTLALPQAVQAQTIAEENVPPLAFGAMLQLYPLARQVKWRRVQEWYQASYTQRQTYRLVRFTTTGEVAATGQDLALGALSLPIKRTLATYYPTRTICRAIEITNTQTGGLTYEMATCETASSRTITLTANGRKLSRPRPH